MQRRALLSGAGGLAAAALAGCLEDLTGPRVTESFSNSYDVSPETVVAISNRNGDVTVSRSLDDQLSVSGEKRANSQSGLDSISIDVTGGEQFVVEVNFGSGGEFSNRSVELEVEVPQGVAVDRARTANGDVTVSEVRGDVRATTSNGEVEVTDVSGYVEVESTNGDVRVRDTTGVGDARTTNGDVDVELLAMRDDVTCKTSNGSVTVRVGLDVEAGIRLSTSNGDASVRDLEYTATTDRRGFVEGRLRGADSPLLTLESNNGDVTLRPA